MVYTFGSHLSGNGGDGGAAGAVSGGTSGGVTGGDGGSASGGDINIDGGCAETITAGEFNVPYTNKSPDVEAFLIP